MIFVFDEFELDPDRAELRRSGEPVPVEPQVFALLSLLVQSGGRLVTRDEIFRLIWGDRIVSEAALSSRIRDARKAVGDDGVAQRLIRTVPRRGLRFLADMSEVVPAVAVTAPEGEAAATNLSEHESESQDEASQAPAVAVLPLEDLTAETGCSLLGDGLTEEIAAALCAWRHFTVVSRNTAWRFRASDLSAPEIGRLVGARYLLSGWVRRSGNRIKLSITLTDAERDYQVWVERFTRDIADLIDLEEEIAAQIVIALVPEIEAAEARRVMRSKTHDPTAWELAMLAAWQANRGASADYEAAIENAMRAAERAPDWYLPCSLIAFCRFQQAMGGFSAADSRTAFSATLQAARQALETDRNSWLANALAAVGELWTNRNHERALLHIEKAVELNPSAAQLYHFAGCITGFSGDPVKARRFQERIFRMDPLYPYAAVIEADIGLWHLISEEYSDADNHLTRAQNWDPGYGRALQRRIALAGLTGDRPMAIEAARKMSDLGLALDRNIIADSYPFRMPVHQEMFLSGLQRSGINF
jgi:TolB-like protein